MLCVKFEMLNFGSSKGQLISKSPFGVIILAKKTNEIFLRISALASKKRSDHKNKGTLNHLLGAI